MARLSEKASDICILQWNFIYNPSNKFQANLKAHMMSNSQFLKF